MNVTRTENPHSQLNLLPTVLSWLPYFKLIKLYSVTVTKTDIFKNISAIIYYKQYSFSLQVLLWRPFHIDLKYNHNNLHTIKQIWWFLNVLVTTQAITWKTTRHCFLETSLNWEILNSNFHLSIDSFKYDTDIFFLLDLCLELRWEIYGFICTFYEKLQKSQLIEILRNSPFWDVLKVGGQFTNFVTK